MRELVSVMVRSGVVSPDMQQEIRRWGVLTELPGADTPPHSLEEFNHSLQKALDDEHLVLVRETDVDVLGHYLRTMHLGELVLVTENEDVATSHVTYGALPSGELLLPWKSEGIEALLLNNKTFLRVSGGRKLYIKKVRELFFGDRKTFLACEAYSKEDGGALNDDNADSSPSH